MRKRKNVSRAMQLSVIIMMIIKRISRAPIYCGTTEVGAQGALQ